MQVGVTEGKGRPSSQVSVPMWQGGQGSQIPVIVKWGSGEGSPRRPREAGVAE